MKKKDFKYSFMIFCVIMCYIIAIICLVITFIVQVNLQMERYGVYITSVYIWNLWDILYIVAIIFLVIPEIGLLLLLKEKTK